ncbi:MAG: hypothetical protein KIT19_12830 [Phycisphaeraceae bacterium]|nr:hypothetical protein [Phycisphaeraceae bacterium]
MTMIETLAAAVLVAMMAVALMQTATIVRAAHRRSSESAVLAERTLVELRERALASREQAPAEAGWVEGVAFLESSLHRGSFGVGPGARWIVVSGDGVGVAVWSGWPRGQRK